MTSNLKVSEICSGARNKNLMKRVIMNLSKYYVIKQKNKVVEEYNQEWRLVPRSSSCEGFDGKKCKKLKY